MDDREIGLRAQDVQAGLQDVDLTGPAYGVFDQTLVAGMAERLAIHVRGVDVIDDPQRLQAVAQRLGISSFVLRSVLDVLEEAEFISVQYKGGQPARLTDRVPLFGDIYQRIGEIWRSRSPTEEETATLQLLQELAEAPRLLGDVKASSALDTDQLQTILDVGRSGGYLSEFGDDVNSSAIVYSPLYWEEHPEETFRLVEKWGGERIASAIKKVRSSQGMPIPDAASKTEEDQIITEAMAAGLLPSPEVTSNRGPRKFAFTPYSGQIGLGPHERPVLQKARALLACVRYGQHFGTVTRVVDPSAIIQALSSRGRIGPHTEIAKQYAILVVEGIARISRDTTFPSRFHLQIVDTEENKKALRLASELVMVGEAISDRGLDDEARGILFGVGTIKDSATTRSNFIRQTRGPDYDPKLFERELAKLLENVREPS